MIVALYILGALLLVGLVLKLTHCPDAPKPEDDTAPPADDAADNECCGMHITCEKDSLLAGVSDDIEYFEDEDLDRYKGRGADDYTDDEIEQFRDVLLTLRPDEIAAWGRSIQLRGITLPAPVRDELLMIVAEARKNASSQ